MLITRISFPPLNYRIVFCKWLYHVPRHWLSNITWYYIGSPCIHIGTADSVPFWGRVVVICIGCVPRQIVKSKTQLWLKQNETAFTSEGISAVGLCISPWWYSSGISITNPSSLYWRQTIVNCSRVGSHLKTFSSKHNSWFQSWFPQSFAFFANIHSVFSCTCLNSCSAVTLSAS